MSAGRITGWRLLAGLGLLVGVILIGVSQKDPAPKSAATVTSTTLFVPYTAATEPLYRICRGAYNGNPSWDADAQYLAREYFRRTAVSYEESLRVCRAGYYAAFYGN